MTKRLVDLGSQRPLLDIASYGRRGPGQGRAFTSAEIAHAGRTARGAPEVMVKVSGGARSARGVASHLEYIGRKGRGDIETDDGQVLHANGAEQILLKDWDLDLPRATGTGSAPPLASDSRRSSFTTSCSPCQPARLQKSYAMP